MYLVAARRLLAVLERSKERIIDSSDLERLIPGVSWLPCNSHSPELLAYESCYALLEAQHSSSYMMRRALACLETGAEAAPHELASIRLSHQPPTAPFVDGISFCSLVRDSCPAWRVL
jgi:hypothetical protein